LVSPPLIDRKGRGEEKFGVQHWESNRIWGVGAGDGDVVVWMGDCVRRVMYKFWRFVEMVCKKLCWKIGMGP